MDKVSIEEGNRAWIPVTKELPPNGELVETKIDDLNGERNHADLSRHNNLWFSGTIYVYYSPTHWRRKANTQQQGPSKETINSQP